MKKSPCLFPTNECMARFSEMPDRYEEEKCVRKGTSKRIQSSLTYKPDSLIFLATKCEFLSSYDSF